MQVLNYKGTFFCKGQETRLFMQKHSSAHSIQWKCTQQRCIYIQTYHYVNRQGQPREPSSPAHLRNPTLSLLDSSKPAPSMEVRAGKRRVVPATGSCSRGDRRGPKEKGGPTVHIRSLRTPSVAPFCFQSRPQHRENEGTQRIFLHPEAAASQT